MGNFTINTHSHIENELENKKVLYIPIVSMRSYEDNTYNLACDGNVNRFLSKLSFVKNVDITITLPRNNINVDFIHSKLKKMPIKYSLMYVKHYGTNALETRQNLDWIDFVKQYDTEEFDIILFEPNIIGSYDFKNVKPIYWLPVSNTINKEVSFVKDLFHLDKEASEKYTTFVCSPNQQKLFPNSILDNNNFNPELFIHNPKKVHFQQPIIFIPFRQSDAGYRVDYIYETLAKIKKQFLIITAPPNDYEIETDLMKIRIHNTRENYYQILNSSPIIIYLENPDEILHISPFEFIHFDCKMIYMKNELFHHNNRVGELNDISELENCLKEML